MTQRILRGAMLAVLMMSTALATAPPAHAKGRRDPNHVARAAARRPAKRSRRRRKFGHGGTEVEYQARPHHRQRVSLGFADLPSAHMTALSLAQTAATEYWGPPPCAVSIAYAPASAAPAVDTDGVPVPVLWAWTDSASCVVTVNSDRWPLVDQNIDFPDFCGLIVHEYGHLFGHPDLATDSPASITYPFVGPLNEGVAPCVGRYRLALRSS